MARALRAWDINQRAKNSVHNLQNGPRTRLGRGVCCFALRFREITYAKRTSFPRASSGDLLWNEKRKNPFVLPLVWTDTSFIIDIITQISYYYCFASANEYGAERAGFEFVLSGHRFDTRRVDFFLPSVSSLISKVKHLHVSKKPCCRSCAK